MGTEIDNDSALFERGNESRYFATLAIHKFRYEFSDDVFSTAYGKWFWTRFIFLSSQPNEIKQSYIYPLDGHFGHKCLHWIIGG